MTKREAWPMKPETIARRTAQRREDDIRHARASVSNLEDMADQERRAGDGDPILAGYYQKMADRIRESMPFAFKATRMRR